MFVKKAIEDAVQQLMQVVPAGLQCAEQDMRRQFHDSLHYIFDRLDLVTREEFDAQTKVLLRTRAKLEELTKQLEQFTAQQQDT